ncbi:MAG: PAS domain S-box protein, partial [Thermoplasmatota archaeon]
MEEEKRSERFEQLRKKAERKLDEAMEKTEHISEEESRSIKELVHELQVHQIELELQNQELRETKTRLQRSKKRYADLYDSVPISYLTLDKDGNILSANQTAVEKLRMKREELEDEGFYKFVKEEYKDPLYKHLRKAFKTQERQTCELEIKNNSSDDTSQKIDERKGQDFYGLLESKVYNYEDEVLCRTALIDISEQKEAKEKLQESEERYRRLFETAQEGMLILDAGSGKIIDANPFIKDMMGYSLENIKGKHLWEIETFSDISENKEEFNELREKEYVHYEELLLKTKEGKEKTVEFVSKLYNVGENEIIQCSIRDITDRIRAQEREDTLHSLLRHDVANKNRVVEGYLVLLEEYDFDENIEKLIKNSKRAIGKSLNLIEKVRILRQAQNEKIEEVDISSMIKNTVNDMRTRVEEDGMELKMGCPEKECIVEAGPLLNNVFSNLIENAVKHSDGSKLRVNVKIDE